MRRQLIYIPIIHTEVDMGSLVGPLREKYIQKYGAHKWHEHMRKIHNLWTGIEGYLDQKQLYYKDVKIYQDGLPVCGNELQIVRDIAGSGGRNHQLLMKLIDKGATLMGTEDPVLLMKEYQLIKDDAVQGCTKRNTGGKFSYIEERDAFIAHRIDETLKDGEIGILFLGMLHKVIEKLPSDIVVLHMKLSTLT